MVISNAGWTKFANFYDLNQKVDEAVWDRCFLANVNSHLFLLHTAKENLQNPNGAFVMTSSVAGVKAQWQLNCMLLPNLVHLAYV